MDEHPEGPYLIGCDLGTSGCKSIVMDSRGAVLSWAIKDYPTISRQPGWAEQNPGDWFEAFRDTLRRAVSQAKIKAKDVAMICIVGITHNAVLLDSKDRVLRPSIIYTDIRSMNQSQSLLKAWGERIFEKTWNQISPIWTWPQLLWISENQPEIWERVNRIFFPKDYLRHLIVPQFVSDTIDPAGSLLYDPIKCVWIPDFYKSLGLNRENLPEIVSPYQIVGELNAKMADSLDLIEGTPVIAGSTDTAAEVFGVGATRLGQSIIKLATVGRIAAISTNPLPSPEFLNYHHILDGLWYPGTATKFAASAFNWARKAFWNDINQTGIYTRMDAAATTVPPGSEGLLFHPYLAGEFAPSWDPHLRACYTGVSLKHTRAHFTRAVMEGVGFALRSALESVIEMGLVVDEVRLIGGGAKSDLWAQIITDIIDREVLVPSGSDAAFGAALMAGVAAGVFDNDPSELQKLVKIRSHLKPEASRRELYQELYEIHQRAAGAIKNISHQLHQFQTQHQVT
ncbi:MAG: FGGY family carbohydrate kinase [Anaerolineales bacterium]